MFDVVHSICPSMLTSYYVHTLVSKQVGTLCKTSVKTKCNHSQVKCVTDKLFPSRGSNFLYAILFHKVVDSPILCL